MHKKYSIQTGCQSIKINLLLPTVAAYNQFLQFWRLCQPILLVHPLYEKKILLASGQNKNCFPQILVRQDLWLKKKTPENL